MTVIHRFDFGPVLSRSEPLKHEFVIENPTGDTIQVVRSMALTPCCSSIERHPEKIPPFGKVAIPVVLNPGSQSGPKSVSFSVETDKPSHPDYRLELLADLHPEWEVAPSDLNRRSFPIGLGGRLEFSMIRRERGEQVQPPDTIDISSPSSLSVDLVRAEQGQIGDFAEDRRWIAVKIPPSIREGRDHAVLRFRWLGGEERNHEITWEVTPAIQVTSSILLLHKAEGVKEYSILLASEHGAFRITKVDWPSRGEMPRFDETAGLVRKLSLMLDPSKIDPSVQPTEILIRTDHPDQPTVKVKVLVLDEAGKGVER